MKELFLIILSFSGGVAIAAGVFAFIATIGIIPRMAQRTRTEFSIPIYEDAVLLGGAFGCTPLLFHYQLPIGVIGAVIFAILSGIFMGVLAMALTEVLNVIPILLRRTRLTHGISVLILAFALGKLVGSLAYFLIEGFYTL